MSAPANLHAEHAAALAELAHALVDVLLSAHERRTAEQVPAGTTANIPTDEPAKAPDEPAKAGDSTKATRRI